MGGNHNQPVLFIVQPTRLETGESAVLRLWQDPAKRGCTVTFLGGVSMGISARQLRLQQAEKIKS
jgi:hypothetical protein